MKKIVLFSVLCLIAASSFAQEVKPTQALGRVFRLHVLNPGVEYEAPLYKNLLLSANIGLSYGFSYSNTTSWSHSFTPFLDVELKHLYSTNKRIRKGKSTKGNSGNYYGLRLLAHTESYELEYGSFGGNGIFINPVWGLQRTYGIFEFLFDFGPSYHYEKWNGGTFLPIYLQLNLGFDLSKLVN